MKTILPLLILCCLCSCKKFEMSPYAVHEKELPSGVNQRNIKRLQAADDGADDTIRIFLCGDSQRFYDELDAMVNKANNCAVDFVLLAGDITDFGLQQEFAWVYDRLEKLNKPYICVIGNHDFNGNGSSLYAHVFGARNFSFVFRHYKFLCHDTNSREHNFDGSAPNTGWLHNQMSEGREMYYAAISHVPPGDTDFDPALKEEYTALFANNPQFSISMHGHMHSAAAGYTFNDHVMYVTTNCIGHREAYLIKLYKGTVITEKITF